MIIRARSPFHIKIQSVVETSLPVLTCDQVTISGLSIAADGTITNPTVTGATFNRVQPSSFDTVEEETVQYVTVVSDYNSSTHLPPSETSTELHCIVSATQPATIPVIDLSCREYVVINYDNLNRDVIVSYLNCSNVSTTATYPPDGVSNTICVYNGRVPYVSGFGHNNFIVRQTNTTCT